MKESAPHTISNQFSGPESWLDEHGDYLYRYAYSRVRNESLAEDLVQETLLAAINGWNQFEGRASVRTWLVGILRNKLIDNYRKAIKEPQLLNESELPQEVVDKNFNRLGIWNNLLSDWAKVPDKHLENKDFYKVLDRCIEKLPPNTRTAFILRVFEDLPAEEICKLRGITASNFWVLMHRARVALRECIEINWINR